MQKSSKKQKGTMIASIVFWLLVWQSMSMLIGQELLLPAPGKVLATLFEMASTAVFWKSILASLWRITAGFGLGLATGVLLAAMACGFTVFEILLRPLMLLIKAIPVASFIILALVWVSGKNISILISFTIVLPVMYAGTVNGIKSTDPKLLEMARVFEVPFTKRVRAIYLPALLPSLFTAVELGLGLCWKSGVAAEIIGLQANTIGERIYQAKIFLMTPELFAWTVVVVLVSWVFSKLVVMALKKGASFAMGGGKNEEY